MQLYRFRGEVILLALISLALVLAPGCGSLKDQLGAEAPSENLLLLDMGQGDARNPEGALIVEKASDKGSLSITLVAAKDFETHSLTYHLNYNADAFHASSANVEPVLGDAETAISAAITSTPGVVALGQVRIGLESQPVSAGTVFATVVLSTGGKAVLDDANSNGAKVKGYSLRKPSIMASGARRDFANQDVPFTYAQGQYVSGAFQLGGEQNVLRLSWEEANDGDFDTNGVVTIADLTPLGAVQGDDLKGATAAPPEEWMLESGSNPDELHISRTLRPLIKENVNSTWMSDDYPQRVERYDGELTNDDAFEDAYLDVQPGHFYKGSINDLSDLGPYLLNEVKGYEVYLIAGNPASSISDSVKLGAVTRPDVNHSNFGQSLEDLGYLLPEHPNAGQTYAQWFTASGLRRDADFDGGTPPDPAEPVFGEKPLYFFERDLYDTKDDAARNLLANAKAGSLPVYAAVVPITSEASLPVIKGTSSWDEEAYTYHEVALDLDEITAVSVGAPTYSGAAGIIDADKVGDFGWKVTFNQADLPGSLSPSLWEVRYAVYYSFKSNSASDVFKEDAAGKPLYKYYPPDGNNVVTNIQYNVNGYTITGVDPPEYGTLHLGVRAYVRSKTSSSNTGPTEKNTAVDSDVVFIDPDIDTVAPQYDGIYNYNEVGKFSLGIRPTSNQVLDGMGNPTGKYFVDTSIVPHQFDQNETGPAWIAGVQVPIHRTRDFDNAGTRTPDAELEYRMEVYRVHDIDSWKDLRDPTNALTWRASHEDDLFAVALAKAKLHDTSNDETFWKIDRTLDDESPPYLTICSPLHMANPAQTNTSWWIRSRNYEPVGSFSDLPETDFQWVTDPPFDLAWVSFCGNPDMEINPTNPPPSGHAKWGKYVIFTAVNDEENNSSYGSAIRSHQYFDEVPRSGGTRQLYPEDIGYALQAYRDGYGYPGKGILRVTSDPVQNLAGQHRGFDMAYDPINNRLGWTYVNASNHKLVYWQMNLTTGAQSSKEVCSASVGNTSLSYDRFGDIHVAYYLTNFDDEDSSGGGTTIPHTISSAKGASSDWGHIYYRKHQSNAWSARELVNDAYFVSSAEHTLIMDTTGNPAAVVPDLDQVSDTVAYSTRSGTAWSPSTIPVAGTSTGEYIDSIHVGATTYGALFNRSSGTVKLISKTYPASSFSTLATIGSGEITGHQSIALIDSNTLGLAYQVDISGRKYLAYGTYSISGSSFTPVEVPPFGEAGYQSSVTTDEYGNPVIVSVSRDDGQLLLCYHNGERWRWYSLGFTQSGEDYLPYNTVALERVGSDFHCVYMSPTGAHSYCKFTLEYD